MENLPTDMDSIESLTFLKTDSQSMGIDKIIIRIIVGTILLLEWVIPVVAFNMQEDFSYMKVHDFFEVDLFVLKVVAVIVLVVPSIPLRIKLWAYIGFGVKLISVCVAHLGGNGKGLQIY